MPFEQSEKGKIFQMTKITIEDKEYPKQLKEIKNPPKQLYLEGNTELLKQNIISIVGSRNCTQNGKKLAKKFASELTMQKITIASGMAKGIDSAAHIGTMEAGGKTIAVLGNGFNNIFPKENIELYKEIIREGGLIVSEYPPDTEAKSNLFLERNRIVSGLSIGVLVVEAAHRSGTSVTAKLAESQGRKVFVLPHEIDDKYGVGTNNLIKKGAILITSTRDIINNFKFLRYIELENASMVNTDKNIKNKIQEQKINKTLEVRLTNKIEKEVYMLIKNGNKEVNEIAKKSNKSISEITNALLMLELDGAIKKIAGGYKCI